MAIENVAAEPPEATGWLERDSQGMALMLSRTFYAPARELWGSLTLPDELAKWIGRWSGTAGIGKTIAFEMIEEDGTLEHVTILGCEPPRHFRGDFGRSGDTWRVGFDLSDAEGITTLTLKHYLRSKEDLADIGPGWEWYLDRLVASRENGTMPDWDDYYPALSEYYERL
ncbi:MAG: SRPBCC domain-containing protein [Microbacteriaceae bacterium]